MTITIKRIDKTLPLPEYATSGSCGFDLYSRISATIEPHQIVSLPTNLIIDTPANHVLILAARSSLAKKKGLVVANAVGIIDSDFSGNEDEICVLVRNITDQSVTIEKGERIAQALFLPVTRAEWQEVDQMDSQNRGGFGSTGGYQN